MRFAASSSNSAVGINWRYLGLGAIILISLIVGLHLVEIPSFGSQTPSVSKQANASGNNSNNTQLEVRVEIEKPNNVEQYQLNLETKTTAFAALNNSQEIEYKRYEQGYFITAIGGVKQNETHSWLYFVNGKPPSQAVNNYRLEQDDKLSFRYLSQKESQKYFE